MSVRIVFIKVISEYRRPFIVVFGECNGIIWLERPFWDGYIGRSLVVIQMKFEGFVDSWL